MLAKYAWLWYYILVRKRNEEVSQAVVKASDANTMFTDEEPKGK